MQFRPANVLLGVARLVTVAFIAVGLLSACSSEEPAPPPPQAHKPVLDGTYRVQIDGRRTLRDGVPAPEAPTSLQWAFRSSCAAACVAVAVPVDDEKPPKTGGPSVFDLIDDAWVKTIDGQLPCRDAQAPTLETWSLRPQDDGSLSGTRHLAFFGGTCSSVLEQFVTANRTGAVDPAVTIPDPAAQTPLTTSAGSGWHGRYRKIQTPLGHQPPVQTVELVVTTNCIRNTERCLTYTVYDPSGVPHRRVRAYELVDGRWTSVVPYDVACPDGRPARIIVATALSLPPRPADPIEQLVGVQRDVYAEPCAKTVESQLLMQRIGN